MTRTKQKNRMGTTLSGRSFETEAEKKAREAYEAADAAWLAACDAQENSHAAELSVQRSGLLQLYREEKAKATAAWQKRMKRLEAETEAELREEAAAEAAAEAAEAALEEREEAALTQVMPTVKRGSQKRKRKTLSTPHAVTPPNSSSTLILRLLQAVEEAGDAPDDQLVDLLRTSMKEIRLTQLDAPRPHEEGPGADLDLHGPPEPAKQGPDAEGPAQQGSGPPQSPAWHAGTTTVLEVPAWSPGLTWEDALNHQLHLQEFGLTLEDALEVTPADARLTRLKKLLDLRLSSLARLMDERKAPQPVGESRPLRADAPEDRRSPKVKEPPTLDCKWSVAAKDDPRLIDIAISRIFDYLEDSKAWKEDDPFPRSFLNFFSDTALVTHLHSLISGPSLAGPMKRSQAQSDVVSSLRRLLTGSSRDPCELHLEALLNGEVTQVTRSKEELPVATYTELFLARYRGLDATLTSGPQKMFCKLYFKGLLPSLQKECAYNEGKEWLVLDDLIKAATQAEHKLSFSSSGGRKTHLNALCHTPFYAQDGSPTKRSKGPGHPKGPGHSRGAGSSEPRRRPPVEMFPVEFSNPASYFTVGCKAACDTFGTCYRCRTVHHPNGTGCPKRGPNDGAIPTLVDERGVPLRIQPAQPNRSARRAASRANRQ